MNEVNMHGYKPTTSINVPPDIVIDPSTLKRGPWLVLNPEASVSSAYDYEVKSWPSFFSKMITGRKKHDMRDKRDRDYKVGDKILFREWDPFGGGYSGRTAIFEVTYITSNDSPCSMSSAALDRNFVILSVQLVAGCE